MATAKTKQKILQTFLDLLADHRLRRHKATGHRRAVDQHGAGAAYSGPADQLGAGQVQLVAQEIDEQRLVGDLDLLAAAVNRQFGHQADLPLPESVVPPGEAIAPLTSRSMVNSRLANDTASAMSVLAPRSAS